MEDSEPANLSCGGGGGDCATDALVWHTYISSKVHFEANQSVLEVALSVAGETARRSSQPRLDARQVAMATWLAGKSQGTGKYSEQDIQTQQRDRQRQTGQREVSHARYQFIEVTLQENSQTAR